MDYRVISCIGILYKIVSKLLAICSIEILSKVISPNQIAFLKGWKIADNITLTQEFTMGFNDKNFSAIAMISIDFSKAFVRLRWDGIEIIIKRLGFDTTERNLVKACISFTSFSALIEGSPTHIFHPKRGILQGDLISPFLFIMALKYLSRRTIDASQRGDLELFDQKDMMVESHLAYAENVVFFCRTSQRSLNTLKGIMVDFMTISGLQINENKSLLFSQKEYKIRTNYGVY